MERNIKLKKEKHEKYAKLWRDVKYNKYVYFMLLPAIVSIIVFHYMPMPKLLMAFTEYNIYNPDASPWVGLENFRTIFESEGMVEAIFNTLYVSILNLFAGFPLTIIFALMINEVKCMAYKKVVQTLSYLPHFLSWIAIIGMYSTIMAKYGPINDILSSLFGLERELFLSKQEFFVPSIVFLSVWQGLGWSTIVYLSAIAGVDESLYEAVMIDGGGRFRQIYHITLPSIRPTIAIMLVLQLGRLLGSNFELVYGLQNPFIEFETTSTYNYKYGIEGGQYSLTTAFGLFTSVIGFVMTTISNSISKKITGAGLF